MTRSQVAWTIALTLLAGFVGAQVDRYVARRSQLAPATLASNAEPSPHDGEQFLPPKPLKFGTAKVKDDSSTTPPAEAAADDDIVYVPDAVRDSQPPVTMASRQQVSGQQLNELWNEALSTLPPEQAQDILTLKRELGSIAAQSMGIPEGSLRPAVPNLFPVPKDTEIKQLAAVPTASPIELTALTQPEVDPELKKILEVLRTNQRHQLTPGYRRHEVLLTVDAGAASSPAKIRWETQLDLRLGAIVLSTNSFDLAINGFGWFAVSEPTGATVRLTRCGRLSLTKDRELAVKTAQGQWPLNPKLVLPEHTKSWDVTANGECHVWKNDSTEPIVIGRLMLANCLHPARLTALGDGTYRSNEHSGDVWFAVPGERGLGFVQQGCYETSNASETEDSAQATAIQQQFKLAHP